ncbi:DUF1365 domain-containing protein [Gordonia sp. NB41Y]|uniref:DUF1365 domain-containing protein n=1 Tax=Gordonia sp. NB41Y TaxID=875808 RepID=UPI0002BE07C0|nr:DUF1365 domain-containing protein [Gordonia sp. NB41Y]WLP92820.1 DUF1365 domain-containing protein [Gordonia sp. NB41Y]
MTTTHAPAPPTTALVVRTRITHERRSPIRHAFSYSGTSWLIDVDAPPAMPRGLGLLADFRAGDHFPQPARPSDTLRSRIDEFVRNAGIEPVDGRIVALLSPRVGGYVFNPLSVFWCHRRDGTLAHVVAEVHNTYGGRHCYVVHPDADGRALVDKEFYVSPFNDVSGRYRLRVPEPRGGRVAVSIILDRVGQPPFVATLTGQGRPVGIRSVLVAQVRSPMAPLVVAARIRLHGIRLWARRLPLHPRPPRHSTTGHSATIDGPATDRTITDQTAADIAKGQS